MQYAETLMTDWQSRSRISLLKYQITFLW